MIGAMLMIASIAAANPPEDGRNPPSQTNIDSRWVAAAGVGLTPACAAASGMQPAELRDVLNELVASHAITTLIDPTSTPRVGADHRQRASFGSAATQTRERACAAAGVANEVVVRLRRCIRASESGLPAEWGAFTDNADELKQVCRARVAERRATRLGRTLAPEHASLLHRTRTAPSVLSAEALVQSRQESLRQVIAE